MENRVVDHVYAIPTFHCNLKCPHCELRLKEDNYNRQAFLTTLQSIKSTNITLFGGEPTLYTDRLIDAVKTGKITSISTNLIKVDQQLIDLIKQYDLYVSTSWNVTRFNGSQYQTWIDNVNRLTDNEIDILLLVTLTDDLLTFDQSRLFSLLWQWKLAGINRVRFEQLVDYSKDQAFYDRVDQWLVDVDNMWSFEFPENDVVNQIANWKYNCNTTYTLLPNGQLVFGCPQFEKSYLINDCLACQYAGVCRPCMLQKYCTFPKKLYQKYYVE